MASIARSEHDFVIVSGAVSRVVVDLALEDLRLSDGAVELLLGARDVKGVSLDLVPLAYRGEIESASKYAVERAVDGERSNSSGPDVKQGERPSSFAETVQGFL